MKCTILILFSLLIRVGTNAELYSAVSKLDVLLKAQKDFIYFIEEYLDRSWSSRDEIVRSYLNLLMTEQDLAMKDKNKYFANPVNCFRLIKRLTVDIKFIRKFVKRITDISDLELDEPLYPTQEDLIGAAEGLLRVQATYDLDMNQLAEGKWNTSYGKKTTPYVYNFPPMTVSDCYELGKAAFKIKLHEIGIEWLKVAARKYRNDHRMWIKEDYRFTEDHFYVEINNGLNQLEKEKKKTAQWVRELSYWKLDMNKLDRDLALVYYARNMTPQQAYEYLVAQEQRSASLYEKKDEQLSTEETRSSYLALCRGERTKRSIKSNRLSCFYAHGPHKFLKLAPLKAERLHIKPNMMFFHEIINDAEIQTILTITKPKLARGSVAGGVSNETIEVKSRERVCQVGFLMDNESAVVTRVRRRISQFSGLSLAESNGLQVANYGIGGYHGLHYDYSTSEAYIRQEGNRIATAVLYLSDVEQGGATIFPALGLSVFPNKGSALYWLNLRPSGKGDPNNFHAACPVLWGTKWVATQWIKERGQELRRPCPKKSQPHLKRKSQLIA